MMVWAESVEEVRGTARNMEAGDSFPAAGTVPPAGRVATSTAMGHQVGTAAAVVVVVAVVAAQEVS